MAVDRAKIDREMRGMRVKTQEEIAEMITAPSEVAKLRDQLTSLRAAARACSLKREAQHELDQCQDCGGFDEHYANCTQHRAALRALEKELGTTEGQPCPECGGPAGPHPCQPSFP